MKNNLWYYMFQKGWISELAQIGIFSDFWFLWVFVHNTLKNHTNLKCWGEYQKIQEICNKMSTKILKIDGEMPDEIELKVGNPQNSNSRNWANLSQSWNLNFFEDESFQLFSYLYGLKVQKWNCAYILPGTKTRQQSTTRLRTSYE